jgi:protein phosphatase
MKKENFIMQLCKAIISLLGKIKKTLFDYCQLSTVNCQLSTVNSNRLHVRAITLTDAGCVRRNNEDKAGFRFLGGSKTDFIAILADGMGGYEQGEIASDIMVNTVFNDNEPVGSKHPDRWLFDAVEKANSRIYELAIKQQTIMGTTCSALLIWKKKIYFVHAGDSRIYLLARNKLKQLTCDHTVVGEMMRKGGITAAEAAIHPQRSVLTKAIGTSSKVKPDLFKLSFPVRKGNRFLLCSDGLYDLVPDGEICRLLAQSSLRTAAKSLVETARKHGGYDNISVIIVEINEKNNNNNNEL